MKSFTLTGKTISSPGRAVNLDDGTYDRVVIDGCTFNHTGGIFIQAKPNMSILIQNCTFNEIIRTKGMEYAQAIQVSGLDSKSTYKPIPIALTIQNNTITNSPGVCDVEDCINLIMVGGTRDKPLNIVGNRITGAYPLDLSPKSLATYSGGGIMCDRGVQMAYVRDNEVHETTNYGIGVAGGIGNLVRANTVTAKHAQNVGIYCYNVYKQDPFKDNVVKKNIVDWQTPHGQNNYYIP